MAQAAVLENTLPADTQLPYPPSWLDRLQDWVDRLPVPYWLSYILLGVILLVPLTLIHWQFGAYPVGTISLLHVWVCVEISLLLAWMHYLDRAAAQALATARSTLNLNDADYTDLAYRLTHLPARTTLFVTLTISLLPISAFPFLINTSALGTITDFLQTTPNPLTLGGLLIVFAATWALFGVWFLHTIHQLRLINRIYAQSIHLNLYDPGPIYAFSGVTARSAILFILIPIVWPLTEPAPPEFASSSFYYNAFYYVIGAGVALIVFILPLWGIHIRLGKAKDGLLSQVGRRIESTTNALHQDADTRTWDNASKIKDMLVGLETEQRMIEKMPTFPWAPGTFRVLLSAILLPVFLFLIQFVITRLFAR